MLFQQRLRGTWRAPPRYQQKQGCEHELPGTAVLMLPPPHASTLKTNGKYMVRATYDGMR